MSDRVVQAGEASQVETVSEENKGLIWGLLKQLRPGMDLSKVVLPTFILEPRSFLDKLSDYYYHADLLSQSVTHICTHCRRVVIICFCWLSELSRPSSVPQSCAGGECIWSHQTGAEMVLIWILQEAQGEIFWDATLLIRVV